MGWVPEGGLGFLVKGALGCQAIGRLGVGPERKVAAFGQTPGGKVGLILQRDAQLAALTCGLCRGARSTCWGYSLPGVIWEP